MSKLSNTIKKWFKIDYLPIQDTFNEDSIDDLGGETENVISNTKKTTKKEQ